MQDQPTNGSMFNGSPKAMFLMGLFLGIAGSAIVVLILVVTLLFTGKTTAWMANNQAAPVAVAPTPTDPSQGQTPPSGPVKPVDEKNDHIRGPKNAKVTLIEYSDFECPFCLRHIATVEQTLKDYPKDVRLVYRHFPLSFHPQAQKAAEAAECAGKQGKFWEMHDEIFKANAANLMSVAKWKEIARTLKLDGNKFDKCLDPSETAAHIAQDEQEGGVAGVSGTPATFINGELVSGAVPYAQFKQIIDAKLK